MSIRGRDEPAGVRLDKLLKEYRCDAPWKNMDVTQGQRKSIAKAGLPNAMLSGLSRREAWFLIRRLEGKDPLWLPEDVAIQLSQADAELAAQEAMDRRSFAIKAGLRDRLSLENKKLSHELGGAAAEIAVHRFLNYAWRSTAGHTARSDVGPFEVRWTSYPNGCLKLYLEEPEVKGEIPFVLVTGVVPNLHIRGYMHAKAAQQDEYRCNPGGRGTALFVPQSDLHEVTRPQSLWGDATDTKFFHATAADLAANDLPGK